MSDNIDITVYVLNYKQLKLSLFLGVETSLS